MYELIKDQGQNILTFVTLLLLAYQTWINNRQFRSLNKGYLHGTPKIILITPGTLTPIAPSTMVAGLSFQIDLLNAGNFPIRFRVQEFKLSIGGMSHSLSSDQIANPLGILYPKQEQNFRIQDLPINAGQTSVPFSSIFGVPITITLKIAYRENPSDSMRFFERDCLFHFNAAKSDHRWTSIRDTW